jgi:hypothetical protein
VYFDKWVFIFVGFLIKTGERLGMILSAVDNKYWNKGIFTIIVAFKVFPLTESNRV